MKSYTFKVSSFRKNPSPYNEKSKIASYTAICDVRNLPLDIPTEHTNPRDQKLTHGVAKAITHSFITDDNFWLLNRGILFSVDSVKYDNSTNKVTITFTDDDKHGNVDGGHTYKVIKENIGKLDQENTPETQFVRLEIVTGVEDFFEDLADARNTSNQVDTKSLAELNNQFDVIKNAIKNAPFYDDIAFRQYEAGKRIDARAIVALVGMFNPEMYPLSSQPVQTYSSKETCTKKFVDITKKPGNSFEKMHTIIPDIFKLYSHIEVRMPQMYNQSKPGAKYGAIKGVISKPTKTLFTKEDNDYETSEGFIYPILAAFRALISETPKGIVWKFDPFECFEDIGQELVLATIERSRSSGHNPQSVGKDSGHWSGLFDKVQNYSLKKELEILQKKAK